MKRLFFSFLVASFVSSMSHANATEFNTDKIGQVLKNARDDLTLVCAHRGLHGSIIGTNSHPDWLRNVPENSTAAISQAVANNIECSEIDVRLDGAGNVVALHDSNLGRTTSVSRGRGEYDPYSGKGYNPQVTAAGESVFGLNLRYPSLNGYSSEKVESLQSILAFIRNNRLATVIFLDIRDVNTARKAWPIVKSFKNAWGTPATDWVYFKMNISNIAATAQQFEALNIFDPATESNRFRFIPVFFANYIDTSNGVAASLNNWSGYYNKNYVYATELEMKEYDSSLAFPLDNIMNTYYAKRTVGRVKVMGNYQPVPETRSNTYYALDGHCCTDPRYWHWTSTRGFGRDTGDNRPNLKWIMGTANGSYSYVITDDPLTAVSTLRAAGRRNIAAIAN